VNLAVFSHKGCWPCADSPTGYATDGGFPFQMKALSELFDETRLLVPCYPRTDGKGEIALAGHRLSVVPLSARMGSGFSSKFGFIPWLLRNSPTILRELRCAGAVHAPIPGDVGTVGMLGAWFFRKPLFVRYCGNWLTVKTAADRFWHSFMERVAGGRNVMLATGGTAETPSAKSPCVRWIFSSSLTAEEMKELGTSHLRLDPANLRLITVGRQEARKGTDKLIEALPSLNRHYPSVQLDVVGDGSDIPRLRRMADDLEVGGQVVFRGKVDHSGVLQLLRQANIFCFPSQSEGFPKAVLEAMACGLPVVATSVSVLPMLLSSGAGVLIDPDASSIEAAVNRIASSQTTYDAMSRTARAVAQQYTLESWRDTIGDHLRGAWGRLKEKDEGGNLKPERARGKVET